MKLLTKWPKWVTWVTETLKLLTKLPKWVSQTHQNMTTWIQHHWIRETWHNGHKKHTITVAITTKTSQSRDGFKLLTKHRKWVTQMTNYSRQQPRLSTVQITDNHNWPIKVSQTITTPKIQGAMSTMSTRIARPQKMSSEEPISRGRVLFILF